MLKISNKSIEKNFKIGDFEVLNTITTPRTGLVFLRWLLLIFVLFIIILFMPWQQNIEGKGNVIAFSPTNRMQNIQNIVGGRIEKWNVNEGQLVKKGDTLLVISESKDDYLDPNINLRIDEQILAKKNALENYSFKIDALKSQLVAIKAAQDFSDKKNRLKLKQVYQKYSIDSSNFETLNKNYEIAKDRLERYEKGQKNGLFSKTELETRILKVQDDFVKIQETKLKMDILKNEILNAQIEIKSVNAEYQKEFAKANSDLSSSMISLEDGKGELSKIVNKSANVLERQVNYVVKAPQNGYILKTIKSGIGEYLKEGETICAFQPSNPDMAIEMFVNAADLPLIRLNKEVRIQFEGWPVLVFSGWRNSSIGTFGGNVTVIERTKSSNNLFRILVKPQKNDHPWPSQIGYGSAIIGWIMLEDVPIWYELWRLINSFPPDNSKESTLNSKGK